MLRSRRGSIDAVLITVAILSILVLLFVTFKGKSICGSDEEVESETNIIFSATFDDKGEVDLGKSEEEFIATGYIEVEGGWKEVCGVYNCSMNYVDKSIEDCKVIESHDEYHKVENERGYQKWVLKKDYHPYRTLKEISRELDKLEEMELGKVEYNLRNELDDRMDERLKDECFIYGKGYKSDYVDNSRINWEDLTSLTVSDKTIIIE